MLTDIKVNVNGFYRKISLYTYQDQLFCKFGYNKTLIAEIGAMSGARWHPDKTEIPPEVAFALQCDKCWSITNNARNWAQLHYLQGENPFKRYDQPFEPLPFQPRTTYTGKVVGPYPHQLLMAGHQLAYRAVITAAEMGCGKTLAAIMTMENCEPATGAPFWYVSTKSGLQATILELKFWRAAIIPHLFTYEDLVKTLRANPEIEPPPLIIFDESGCIKNLAAQRTQAALHIANRMRTFFKEAAYIICMSGAPAPLNPTDWWSQAEVAFPGFLREGDPGKFGKRLAFVEKGESQTGSYFIKRLGWRDDPEKCDICGQFKDEHDNFNHLWQPSINEIEKLGRRLSGLVLTVRKKDVLRFLPDKIFRTVQCKPTAATLRTAKAISRQTIPAIKRLILLRMLSDGFQYKQQVSDKKRVCPSCNGAGLVEDYCPETNQIQKVTCPECRGDCQIAIDVRETVFVPCPKDDAVRDLLEECDAVGRIVGYAGFTGSVDRVCNVCTGAGWGVIRADGRGWHGLGSATKIPAGKWLEAFQYGKEEYPRLAFIGQPGAAGTGLTLTAAELMFFYSNDFNAGNRIQAVDRIHRPGMTSATIVDLIHLATDEYILSAINGKQDLMNQTLNANVFTEILTEQEKEVISEEAGDLCGEEDKTNID